MKHPFSVVFSSMESHEKPLRRLLSIEAYEMLNVRACFLDSKDEAKMLNLIEDYVLTLIF